MFKSPTLLTVVIIAILFSVSQSFSQQWYDDLEDNKKENFYEVQKSYNDYWSDKELRRGTGWKQFKRWEAFWEPRLYPDGKMHDIREIFINYQNARPKDIDLPLSLTSNWEEVGPLVIPENRLSYQSSGLGRLNVVRIHPNNPNEIWVGAAAGGVWRSIDGGETWEVFDFSAFLAIGVSDIAISPSNPDVVYVATGDYNGAFMTSSYSLGLIKTTNGGKDWSLTAKAYNLPQNYLIGRVLIHPEDHNILIVGAQNGIFKSTDGGNTWESKATFGNTRDMEFKPDDPNIIYAGSTSGTQSFFLKSTDLGETWTQTRTLSNVNRVEIAVTPANPDLVYAVCVDRQTNGYHGLYLSADQGETWTLKSNSPNILSIHQQGLTQGGQGSYDLALTVSPTDANDVYVGGIHIWRSRNQGSTWTLVNHWTGSYGKPFVHADQHYLTIDPRNSVLYSANDGGLFKSTNMGTTWTDLSGGLGIVQYYRIGTSLTNPEVIVGGTQDNGTFIKKGDEWYHIYGGDGMECLIDYTDENIVYVTVYYGSIYRSNNGGASFRVIATSNSIGEQGAWVTPYVIDPQNPEILYAGYRNIWKSTNRGNNWTRISNVVTSIPISHISVSPSDPNYIYFSVGSTVMRTTTGGANWETLHSFSRSVTSIAIDDKDPSRIFVALSGYSDGFKVYESVQGKLTNLSNNLPNVPVNTIIYEHNSGGTIYIGTDIGVFVKDALSSNWLPFNENLPNTVVKELEINYSNGKLYAATFGRGLWATEIYDCDIEKPIIAVDGELEFCQGESVKLSVDGDYSEIKWSNNETTAEITVTTPGDYYATVRNEDGCIAVSNKVSVQVFSVPQLSIVSTNGSNLCEGTTLEFRSSFGYSRFLWSTGDTTRTIQISEPGEYSLTAYTDNNCSAIATIEVVTVPAAEVPIIQREGDLLTSSEAVEYQWYLNDNRILGARSQTYIVKADGKYSVEITDENGCNAMSNSIDLIVSVEEQELNDLLTVIPNPSFDGIFGLQINNNQREFKIVVSDALGREIYNLDSNTSGYNIKIDLSANANGVYFLNYISGSLNKTIKLIKNDKN